MDENPYSLLLLVFVVESNLTKYRIKVFNLNSSLVVVKLKIKQEEAFIIKFWITALLLSAYRFIELNMDVW